MQSDRSAASTAESSRNRDRDEESRSAGPKKSGVGFQPVSPVAGWKPAPRRPTPAGWSFPAPHRAFPDPRFSVFPL